MNNKEIECIVDNNGTKHYVLKNSILDINEKISFKEKDYTSVGHVNYFKNKLLHREDGPAIENVDGLRAFYRNGLLHRGDGPAVDYGDNGYKVWYINGKQYTEEEIYLYNKKNLT